MTQATHCMYCNHLSGYHFSSEDNIGFWSFCIIENCDCFLDVKKNEED